MYFIYLTCFPILTTYCSLCLTKIVLSVNLFVCLSHHIGAIWVNTVYKMSTVFFRYLPGILEDQHTADIMHMLLVFVCSSQYISNPYLSAKLVEVMYVLNPAVQPNTAKISDMLLNNPLASDHLVPALMSFYTGMGVV